MRSAKDIHDHIAFKRGLHNIKRIQWKKKKRRRIHEQYILLLKSIGGKATSDSLYNYGLSVNLKYLLECEKSPLCMNRIVGTNSLNGRVVIPETFSLVDNAEESYEALRQMVAMLLLQQTREVRIDYSQCKKVTLEAQVLLDLILKDIIRYYRLCERFSKYKHLAKSIKDVSKETHGIRRMLFSVGSMAIHAKKQKEFDNVIPYNLCVRHTEGDSVKQIEKKDIDTTLLSDYVVDCLDRMGRSLDDERLDDLCIVIGEILINAEEHSSTKCRYSIGYFEEFNDVDEHYGVFQLVIMNLGDTIYEKFHSPECPNKPVVEKMKKLSEKYTKSHFWKSKSFEEETLWTLYSLQDGVTSVSPQKYSKRGNGSLRFIESFFNLKGNVLNDSISKMTLQSGNTSIIFDGTYKTTETVVKGQKYKVMTFNKTGNIEDKPDTRYVKYVDDFFPGTFITANIVIK